MLDIKTATVIRKHINNEIGSEAISLEDVCRMEPLPVTTRSSSSYTILGLQYSDVSILVWVQFSEKLGVDVRKVKLCSW